jgi:hypothetical protein
MGEREQICSPQQGDERAIGDACDGHYQDPDEPNVHARSVIASPMAAALFGLDANEWQAVFAGVTALGALVAAVVAWRALSYFKGQTEAMTASNTATREQMEAQEKHWEEEQRRERRRDHVAVRPVITLYLDDGKTHPANELGAEIVFRGGQAARDVTLEVSLEERGGAAQCVPQWLPEMAIDRQGQLPHSSICCRR